MRSKSRTFAIRLLDLLLVLVWSRFLTTPGLEPRAAELSADSLVLTNATAAQTNTAISTPAREQGPVITRVKDLLGLSRDEADRGYPVRLRGIIIFSDPEWDLMFFHDGEAGIYVSPQGLESELKAGQATELEGFTSSGRYRPVVIQPRFQDLTGSITPVPTSLTVGQVMTGDYDSQWVEIQSVVRSATNWAGHLILELASGSHRLKAHIPGWGGQPGPVSLIDATVKILCVCGAVLDGKNQLSGVQLFVPSLRHVTIVKPPPPDPFALPLTPIGTLARSMPNQDPVNRVKVHGIVTLQRPGELLFIKDETRSLLVQTRQLTPVEPGDRVEAVGWPVASPFAAQLEEAIFRRIGRATLPVPQRVTPEQAEKAQYDAELVQTEGRVVDHSRRPGEELLVLQSDSVVFEAQLETRSAGARLNQLKPGSRVQITGICSLYPDEKMHPRSFRIFLRSLGDVVVLQAPPWWTFDRALKALATMAAVSIGAFSWVVLLRRRVQQQTENIRRRLEHEGALERRYRELVENANDIVYTHDLEGNLTSINKAGETITGYQRNAGAKINVTQIVAPDHLDLVWNMIQVKLAGRGPTNYEAAIVTANGRRVLLEINSRLIYEDGKPVGVQGIARDITERKTADAERTKLEAQLRQAQKMEAMGTLAGGIAHDFNNSLMVILGFTDLALHDVPPQTVAHQNLKNVMKASRRAKELVKQILTFSRREEPERQPVDLGAIVAEALKLLRASLPTTVEIRPHVQDPPHIMLANPTQMHQVLVNLCTNAAHAMHGAPGTLEVRLAKVDLDQRAAAAHHSKLKFGPYLKLSVSDTGSGIPPSIIDRIFEPFFTTKERGEGTGLGLAVVHGIVQSCGGVISVESQVGIGTTFHLLFPQTENIPGPDVEEASPAPMGNARIMVVDDEAMVLKVMQQMLQRLGYRVDRKSSSVDAWETFSREPGKFDAVILDQTMPQMTGTDLAKKMLKVRPNLPIILCTGYSEVIDEKKAKAIGIRAFHYKPVTRDAIAESLRVLLSPSNGNDRSR